MDIKRNKKHFKKIETKSCLLKENKVVWIAVAGTKTPILSE